MTGEGRWPGRSLRPHPERLLSMTSLSTPHPAAMVRLAADQRPAGQVLVHARLSAAVAARAAARHQPSRGPQAAPRHAALVRACRGEEAELACRRLRGARRRRRERSTGIAGCRSAGKAAGQVSVPTLYVWGRGDAVPRAQGRRAHRGLRDRAVHVPRNRRRPLDPGRGREPLLAHLAANAATESRSAGRSKKRRLRDSNPGGTLKSQPH